MLIGLLTSILIAVVFMAGGLFAETHDLVYVAVGGLIAAVVGVLYGYISLPREDDVAGFEMLQGYTFSVTDCIKQMRVLTGDILGVIDMPVAVADMPIYVGHNGIVPLSGMFLARLNGETALVIEGADPTADMITVHRPLFEKAE